MSAIWDGAFGTNPLLIAGGGGGAPGGNGNTAYSGGAGGGVAGAPDASAQAEQGRGGTATAGGAFGVSAAACPTAATAGTQFVGGTGGSGGTASSVDGGGGGGGGYFGGGGGGCSGVADSGGGGGSGFVAAAVTDAALTQGGGGAGAAVGGATGTNGTVRIQWGAAAVITGPVDGATVGTRPALTGAGTPGDAVEIRDEAGTVLCSSTVQPDGSWTCTPTVDLPTGENTITPYTLVNGQDFAGPAITLDVPAPSAPTITGPTDGSVTNNTTPTLTGTGDDGDTVELRNESGDLVCTTTVVSGTWSCTPTTPLPEGTVTVTPTATNATGVSTEGDPVTITVDTTAPTAPVITGPADGDQINDSTPEFTGTGDDGDTITLTDEDGNTICTTTVTGGVWSCTPNTPLPDGAATITPTATDPAGNTTDGTPVTLVIDTIVPSAPTITGPDDGDQVDDTTPEFTGTGDAGDTVTLVDDAGNAICTVTVPAGGVWSCTPLTPLPEGANTITPTATDAAGNQTPGASVTVVVDTVPPAAPMITSPTDGDTVDTATPTFTGTGDPGDTVELRDDTGAVICTVTVPAGGTWSCTPTTPLPEDDVTVTPVAIDSAGNETAGTPIDLTIDTTPPTSPAITSPADGDVIADATPTFIGTGDVGDTVELRADDGTVLCTVTVPAGGTWSCTPTTPLPEGTATVMPVATDPAGNETIGSLVTVVVDTTPPGPPTGVICSVNPNGTVTCTGTGTAAGDDIVVRDGDGNEICRVTVPAGLDWTCTSTAPVTAFPVEVVEVDPAGNESPAVTTPSPAVITSPTDGDPTNDTTPTFTGTGTPGDTVQLRDDTGATICETTVGADGSWSCTPTAPLPEGTSTITPVTVAPDGTELVGVPVGVVIDTTPPTLARGTVCAQNADGTVTCTGTAEPGSTVRITLPDGTEVCSVVVVAPGQWSCTSTVRVDADRVIVTVTDPAGNTSSAVTVPVTAYVPAGNGNGNGNGGGAGSGGGRPGSGELAFTGADLTGAATTAVLLLLLGGLGVWRAAWRRRDASER